MTLAAAQTPSARRYPSGPVRLIEGFGAGGGPDVIARFLAPKLANLWGRPVTVENHPGGGSTRAQAQVAESPPDGYTLLVNTSTHAYSAALAKNLTYDPLRDFVPIAPITTQAYVFVIGTPAGVTTLGELISAAQLRPGALTFSSMGIGTGSHLGVESLILHTGMSVKHVPVGQAHAIADAIADTVAGRSTFAMWPVPTALPDIRAGRLLPLAVSTARRSRQLPDVPTVAEAGVAGYDFPIWYGVWAPAATPRDVVGTLAEDVARVLAEPDARDALAEYGAEPMSMTLGDFETFVWHEADLARRLMSTDGN